MADAASPQRSSESMEDILQSIKRIIEDDTGAEKKETAGEVLDLTQAIGEDGAVAMLPPAPPPATEPKPSSLPGVTPEPELPPVVEPEFTVPLPTPAMPVLKPVIMEDGLVSDQTAEAAAAALKTISDSAQKDYSIPRIPSPVLRGGNTVEDLLLEALRPMLKTWLDENLPLIVHKIVEKEVKRIVAFHKD